MSTRKPTKVYVHGTEAHPRWFMGQEYDVIRFDPAGDRAVDKAGRKARGIPEPAPAKSEG